MANQTTTGFAALSPRNSHFINCANACAQHSYDGMVRQANEVLAYSGEIFEADRFPGYVRGFARVVATFHSWLFRPMLGDHGPIREEYASVRSNIHSAFHPTVMYAVLSSVRYDSNPPVKNSRYQCGHSRLNAAMSSACSLPDTVTSADLILEALGWAIANAPRGLFRLNIYQDAMLSGDVAVVAKTITQITKDAEFNGISPERAAILVWYYARAVTYASFRVCQINTATEVVWPLVQKKQLPEFMRPLGFCGCMSCSTAPSLETSVGYPFPTFLDILNESSEVFNEGVSSASVTPSFGFMHTFKCECTNLYRHPLAGFWLPRTGKKCFERNGPFMFYPASPLLDPKSPSAHYLALVSAANSTADFSNMSKYEAAIYWARCYTFGVINQTDKGDTYLSSKDYVRVGYNIESILPGFSNVAAEKLEALIMRSAYALSKTATTYASEMSMLAVVDSLKDALPYELPFREGLNKTGTVSSADVPIEGASRDWTTIAPKLQLNSEGRLWELAKAVTDTEMHRARIFRNSMSAHLVVAMLQSSISLFVIILEKLVQSKLEPKKVLYMTNIVPAKFRSVSIFRWLMTELVDVSLATGHYETVALPYSQSTPAPVPDGKLTHAAIGTAQVLLHHSTSLSRVVNEAAIIQMFCESFVEDELLPMYYGEERLGGEKLRAMYKSYFIEFTRTTVENELRKILHVLLVLRVHGDAPAFEYTTTSSLSGNTFEFRNYVERGGIFASEVVYLYFAGLDAYVTINSVAMIDAEERHIRFSGSTHAVLTHVDWVVRKHPYPINYGPDSETDNQLLTHIAYSAGSTEMHIGDTYFFHARDLSRMRVGEFIDSFGRNSPGAKFVEAREALKMQGQRVQAYCTGSGNEQHMPVNYYAGIADGKLWYVSSRPLASSGSPFITNYFKAVRVQLESVLDLQTPTNDRFTALNELAYGWSVLDDDAFQAQVNSVFIKTEFCSELFLNLINRKGSMSRRLQKYKAIDDLTSVMDDILKK